MMKNLVCPISSERINGHVVRLTGLMMATLLALFLLTGDPSFILAALVDYMVRAFTDLPYSPASWLAARIVALFGWPLKRIDRAPKIFAARVGWLFAATAAALAFIYLPASQIVAATLMGFALLEAVLDLCVGCLVYTYIVRPIWGDA
ncbi:MAG: DUF4395 family protein [Anaerolineales bacterium]|nr:DUF4395 family protein [Anaerolineales bacterium]